MNQIELPIAPHPNQTLHELPNQEITDSVTPNSRHPDHTSDSNKSRDPNKDPANIQQLNEKWNTIQALEVLETPHRINDHFRAMGMALFHMGSAVLDYDLIINGVPLRKYGETIEDLTRRYLWAETSARSAQVLLNRAVELAYENKKFDLAPEVKKYCRMSKIWLTTKRQEAAVKIGIDPPPRIEEDVLTDQLDYRYDRENDAPSDD